jgi:hypothetical protein
VGKALRTKRARTALAETSECVAPSTERSPEEIIDALFARVPRRSPSDLAALAREQGKVPAARFEDLLGEGPTDGDEFDVDAFLAERRQWGSEENPLATHLAEPDDAAR